MKHWIATAAAVAAAPLLVACASAGAAQTRYADADERHGHVLVVNGQRVIIRDGAHAVRVIETALDGAGDTSISLDLDIDVDRWDEDEIDAFTEEMEAFSETLVEHFAEGSDFHIQLDRLNFDEDEMQARIEVLVEDAERQAMRAERHAERAAERAERDAERMIRRAEQRAERSARRAEERARHAERHALSISIDAEAIAQAGLAAAEHGLEAGLRAIDRTLERGWKTEDGVRVPLTAEDRRELRDAREELEDSLSEMRDERADWRHERHQSALRHEHTYEDRQVRIIERDGETRVWVNGRELVGAEKETWLDAWRSSEQAHGLEGGPDIPAPPSPPRR
jgi:flagellar biosynthesis GTPase FlhF